MTTISKLHGINGKRVRLDSITGFHDQSAKIIELDGRIFTHSLYWDTGSWVHNYYIRVSGPGGVEFLPGSTWVISYEVHYGPEIVTLH